MKLRLRSPSLRLRLTQSDVAALARSGFLEETIQIGPRAEDRMGYRIELSKDTGNMIALIEGNTITVRVPSVMGMRWADSDEVGIYAQTDWGLKLAIEKDFKCLQPRAEEDDSDAFEHPTGAAGADCGSGER